MVLPFVRSGRIMGRELLIALASGLISFLVFFGIGIFINRQFNIEELPEWIETIIFIAFLLILYFKRGFFFSEPLPTGATIGFILSILWNIKDSLFFSSFFSTVFSLRFLLWIAVTIAGLYKNTYILNIWNNSIVPHIKEAEPLFLVLAVLLYIFGSTLILFPHYYLKGRRRGSGFTMNRRVPASKKVFIYILGIILVFIFSGLLQEFETLIQRLIGLSAYIPYA